MTRNKILLALAAWTACHALHAQTVRICYEDAAEVPWNIAQRQLKNNRLVMQASVKSGVSVELLPLPWKRCLAELAHGRMDGALGASYTEERAAYAVYPTDADGQLDVRRSVRLYGYSLYRRQGSGIGWDGQHFTHLKGPVGVQLGYSVGSDLRKMGVPIVESAGDARAHLRLLAQGQIPLTALLTNEGDTWLLDPEFSGTLEKMQPSFALKPYFVIFNKQYYADNTKTAQDLWAGIAAVRAGH